MQECVVAVAQGHYRINATENHPIPYHTVWYDLISCNNMQYDSAPHQFSRTVISSHYLFWTFRPFMSTSWWEMARVVSLLVYLTWTDSRRQRQPKRPPARILMQYHKTWNHHHLVYLIVLQFFWSFLAHSKIISEMKGCRSVKLPRDIVVC